MKRILILTLVIAMTLSFSIFDDFSNPAAVDAQTGTTINIFQAAFNGTQPTFDSPSCGANTAYIPITTVFDTSGVYEYSDGIYNSSEYFDMEVEIYENSFNPASPATNHVVSFDDSGTITITAGTTYILVVIPHGCDSSTTGTAVFSITGEGSATNTNTSNIYFDAFTGSEPTFSPPGCTGDVIYRVFGPFTVTVSGDYYYTDIGEGIGDNSADAFIVDTELSVYEGGFDPNNPNANYVGEYDDDVILALTVGTPYYFVFTDLASVGCSEDIGQFMWHILGPGVLVLANAGNTVASQPAPQIGMIQINVSQAQPVYESADGDVVRINGQELWIPQDYDGNGFDTHLVINQVTIEGRTWLEIFIGNGDALVWVPADLVTIIE